VVFLDESASIAADRKARLDAADGSPHASDALIFTGPPADLADLLLTRQQAGLSGFRLRPGALPHDLAAISRGLIPQPAEQAAAHTWTDADRELVADRVDTQFVGSPETVAAGLRTLQEATGADELVITTSTHNHADRVRSYELLAKEWNSR